MQAPQGQQGTQDHVGIARRRATRRRSPPPRAPRIDASRIDASRFDSDLRAMTSSVLIPGMVRAAARACVRHVRKAFLTSASGIALVAAAGCTDVASPVDTRVPTSAEVSSEALTFTSLTVGAAHSCGLTADGAAWCWGRNSYGQLGYDTGADTLHAQPARVGGVDGPTFTRIAAGYGHTCGVTSSGDVYCWGRNGSGQLGDGTFVRHTTPTLVPNVTATDLTAGDEHTCAWTAVAGVSLGPVKCWGDNSFGQLGDGSLVTRTSPTPIAGTMNARLVSAGGAHTCAFLGDDVDATSLYCWGSNDFRQIDGTQTWWRTQPTALDPVPNVVSVNAGSWHSCGVDADGAATCWGYNMFGRLGFVSGQASAPGAVGGNHAFAMIDAAGETTCGVTIGGEVWCWGANHKGQLGDSTVTSSVTPVLVRGPSMSTIGVGDVHGCGLDLQGKAWCWGNNAVGQLGDGTLEQRLEAVPVIPPMLSQLRGNLVASRR